MKPTLTLLLLLLMLGGATTLPLTAQLPARPMTSMQIQATELPSFPSTLVARGITSGIVRVLIRVNDEGELDDWIVLGYTEPALANAAVNALQRWEFKPASINGEPVSAQSELVFNFRADGVVINQNALEHFLEHVSGRTGGPQFVYEPATLRQLDQIPTPLHVVSPYYNQEMVERGLRGEVVVDFYIDEEGKVRMPVVDPEEDPELAALAIQAVNQWSFEPPTRRGKPVLVQARQRFVFAPERQETSG